MNLMDLLGQGAGQAAIGQIARQFGVSERDAQSVAKAVIPALSRGIHRNARKPGGMDSLMGALGGGRHDRYVDQPELLGRPETTTDGNAILGHIFGSKDVSRNVAGHASRQTGVGSDIIKKMLPVVASVAMGVLAKQTQSGGQLAGVRSGSASSGSPALDLLGQVLDSDRDGSVVDDVLNIAQRFF